MNNAQLIVITMFFGFLIGFTIAHLNRPDQ